MADTRDVAYAAAMYMFTRTLGMCIGVVLGGTVFQNELKKHLGELHLPTEVVNNAEGFIASLKAFPNPSIQYQAYILAYANSFKVGFELLTAVAGLAAFSRLLIKEYTRDKALDSEHILRQEKEESAPESGRDVSRANEKDTGTN